MTADDETMLLIKRTFDAKAEEVFDAWLTRERWQAWIGPEGMDCTVTVRVTPPTSYEPAVPVWL